MTDKCGKDQVLDFNKKRLLTNLWGIGQKETIPFDKNCIFVNSDNTYGWKWDRPSPVPQTGQTNIAPIAPSVCVGTDPWGGFSTSEYLPIRIRDISSLVMYADYIYSVMPSPEDSQNLSYDIWITDTGNPNPGTPRQELMIWLNRLNVPMPEDKRLEDFSDGYNTYRQYAYGNYTAFIINSAPSSSIKYQNTNPKKLIDYLVAKRTLSSDLWISKIDLGNEVYKSYGKIEILKLNMKINNILI